MAFRVRIAPLAQQRMDDLIDQVERRDRILRSALRVAADLELFSAHGRAIPRLSLPRRPPNPVLDRLHGR
jgi:hypothetical protein